MRPSTHQEIVSSAIRAASIPSCEVRGMEDHTDFIKSLVGNPDIERLPGDAVFDAVYREARKRFEDTNDG